jgi:hypothetical protein
MRLSSAPAPSTIVPREPAGRRKLVIGNAETTMTYDPDRDAKAPTDVNPNARPDEGQARAGTGMIVFVLALITVTLAGFFLYPADNTATMDTTDRRDLARPSSGNSGARN